MDADINAATEHLVVVEEASINNKIKEDHHHKNVLNIAINPDQEKEMAETATDVETRIKGCVQQLIRSARTVRRRVTMCKPSELVNHSHPQQASWYWRLNKWKQNRWLNRLKLYLWLIKTEI
jgi:hypothetical protein